MSSLLVAAAVALAAFVSPSIEPSPATAAGLALREVRDPITLPIGGNPLVNPNGSTNFSSAAVADVTGDGQPEIVVGSMGTRAWVLDLTHNRQIPLDPGQSPHGLGEIQASPAIADIDGDGVDDVVIASLSGFVAAFSVRDGAPRMLYRRYAAPAFEGAGTGLLGTPAIAHVDTDHHLDVITSSWGQTLDVWSGPSGEPLPDRHQWVRDTIWSSPVVGDIDADGTSEIVVGADCLGGVSQPCYHEGYGGYVFAYDLDGEELWRHFVKDAVIWSTPALVDLNGDGALDVVTGTGVERPHLPATRQVIAIDGRSGSRLWSAPTPGPMLGSPSVATIDGEPRIWAVSGGGELLSWNADGERLWSTCIADQPCAPELGTFGGVAIADIDDNGSLEAVVQGESRLRVLDAATGQPRGDWRSRYPVGLWHSYATPTVAEVNGKTWIVTVNIGDASGRWSINSDDEMVVSIWTSDGALGDAPWPTFKRNMARTGGPEPAAPPPVDARGPAATPGRRVQPAERVCFDVAGPVGGAAFVNVTPVDALGAGNGALAEPDFGGPARTSNVNFAPGTLDPNVAIARIGANGQVCYLNSRHSAVHIVADYMGTLRAPVYQPPSPTGDAVRVLDTRTDGAPIGPAQRLCFNVPGPPGDAAIVNLTPVQAEGRGDGRLVSSSATNSGIASSVNYAPGSADPNVAIARIGPDGQVCYVNSKHAAVHLVADHLGTISARAFRPATASGAPVRVLDTRETGEKVGPLHRVCFDVSGYLEDGAIVNVTPVEAEGAGFGRVTQYDVNGPLVFANVNFAPGTIDPNVAIAPIGTNGQVCYHNSAHTWVHVVVDHIGTIPDEYYRPATAENAPQRALDTRVVAG